MNNASTSRIGNMRLSGTPREQIAALAFVKAELELYLDTHPECKTALDYYRQTVDALDSLTEQYQSSTAPLFASGNYSTEEWAWVKKPWPWQEEK